LKPPLDAFPLCSFHDQSLILSHKRRGNLFVVSMTSPATSSPPSSRALNTAYVHALFSMGMMDVLVILVPLCAVNLGILNDDKSQIIAFNSNTAIYRKHHFRTRVSARSEQRYQP
ncbi:MAG: hypothetical protein VX741_02840, partial [Pseudomonadota bacterium]|nr:hypothetical protein [Pseudomonadota bacterium]